MTVLFMVLKDENALITPTEPARSGLGDVWVTGASTHRRLLVSRCPPRWSKTSTTETKWRWGPPRNSNLTREEGRIVPKRCDQRPWDYSINFLISPSIFVI